MFKENGLVRLKVPRILQLFNAAQNEYYNIHALPTHKIFLIPIYNLLDIICVCLLETKVFNKIIQLPITVK